VTLADDELVKEFLVESHENLDRMDRELVELEKDPTSKELLDDIFRTVHTIKGTCAFLEFTTLEHVAHTGETLLGLLREGKLRFSAQVANALLHLVDTTRGILQRIERTGSEGSDDHGALVQRLEDLATDTAASKAAAAPTPLMVPAVAPEVSGAPAPAESPPDPEIGQGKQPAVADRTIRVRVALLDQLMNLVGELVLARDQIRQIAMGEDAALAAAGQLLNVVTSKLQEGVLKARMQPIDTLWSKLPRLVRDVASECNKQVDLRLEGNETELDRALLEALRDPLIHLVRNAIDHGIEAPDFRRARGKPIDGRLHLRAFHESGKVKIVVSDDGAGIDHDRIRRRGVERRLLTAAQAESATERELMELLFLPGFSTVDKITSVSGRGVGMDVVRTNIEKIGGTIEIHSKSGEGTQVEITAPLTLAIIPALIVACGSERYALPQVNLLELLCLRGDALRESVADVHGAPVCRLRGQLLPLVYLRDSLGGPHPPAPTGDAAELNIVVMQAKNRRFGLVVDGVGDVTEIVVKPLGRYTANIVTFAGATILGNGRVALILDVLAVARAAGLFTNVERGAAERSAPLPATTPAERQTLLIVTAGGGSHIAIPLAIVSRLESFPRASIERMGGLPAVRYRGTILPLLHVADLLGERRRRARSRGILPEGGPPEVPAVVYETEQGPVGLVVDEIVDIVDHAITVRRPASRPGVAFTTVVRDRVTELLDLSALLKHAQAELIAAGAEPAAIVLGAS
jgi:two-component system chemotaxis sensor kinase CheA